jgi:hypothetical protein
MIIIALAMSCLTAQTLNAADAAPRPIPKSAANTTAKTVARSFRIPNHGDLVLNVPESWSYSVRTPKLGLPPTIEFLPGPPKQFSALITVMPPAENAPADFNSPAKLRELADARVKSMLPSAKETAINLQDLEGEHATGHFFTVTDKRPEPGSFEYATPAVVGVGDLLLSVTILHHQKEAPQRALALELLKSASQSPKAEAQDVLRIWSPVAKAPALLLPGKGLAVLSERYDRARNSHEVMVVGEESGLVVSVFMEPAQKPGDSAIVRDVYWGRAQRSPLKKQDVKLDTLGELATVTYLVPDVGGQPLNQKHLNLYAAPNGMWVDIHASKTGFEAKDQALFDDLAGQAKFEQAANGK